MKPKLLRHYHCPFTFPPPFLLEGASQIKQNIIVQKEADLVGAKRILEKN